MNGDIGDARVARQLVDSDADTVVGLEVEDRVDFTDFDGDARRDVKVEIDVETNDSLIEVKSGSFDEDTIYNQIVKYAEFRDDPTKDIVVAVDDPDALPTNVEDAINDAKNAIDDDVDVVQKATSPGRRRRHSKQSRRPAT